MNDVSNKLSKVGKLRSNFGLIFMNFGAMDNYLGITIQL
jgi:hypothetical protein